MKVRVRIRAELTVAEPCRSGRDAVLPTLAWAPEGWGCEGANEAPSRTNDSQTSPERVKVMSLQAAEEGAGGGVGVVDGCGVVVCCGGALAGGSGSSDGGIAASPAPCHDSNTRGG